MFKRIFTIVTAAFCAASSWAVNTGGTTYDFLSLPVCTSAAALGGSNVSLHNGDVQLAQQNPALLGLAADRSLALSYTNYITDVQYGSVSYGMAMDSVSWLGFGLTYLNYGSFDAYDIYDQPDGTFGAADMDIAVTYTRRLASHLLAGISLKPIYSYIEDYNSFGLGFDVGAHYYLPDQKFSAGFAVRNFGVQITPYEDVRQNLPCDVQLGITKQLAHAPFRFSITYVKLNQWNFDYVKNDNLYTSTTSGISPEYKSEVKWGDMFMRHWLFGLEFIPNKNFILMASYNHRRHSEFKMENAGSGSGFSFGAALHVYKFNLGFNYSMYGPEGNALGLSLGTALSDFSKKKSE